MSKAIAFVAVTHALIVTALWVAFRYWDSPVLPARVWLVIAWL
jgi:hypothetical protein